MNKKLFHEIAEQVEEEFMCSGLTGGLYEDFAKEILVRYLAAQQSVQADASEEWACKKCGTKNHDVRKNCRVCGLPR